MCVWERGFLPPPPAALARCTRSGRPWLLGMAYTRAGRGVAIGRGPGAALPAAQGATSRMFMLRTEPAAGIPLRFHSFYLRFL
eukprot:COSAG02_NODE_27131_length_616_cov_1.139265_2_plen_82_part_01